MRLYLGKIKGDRPYLDMKRNRRALVAQWLEKAYERMSDPENENCFLGMDETASRHVKHVMDDLYTFCKEGGIR